MMLKSKVDLNRQECMQHGFNKTIKINSFLDTKQNPSIQFDLINFETFIQTFSGFHIINENKNIKKEISLKIRIQYKESQIQYFQIKLRIQFRQNRIEHRKINLENTDQMLRVHNLKETKTYLKDLVCIQSPKQTLDFDETQNNWIFQNTLKNPNQNSIIYDDFIYTDKLTNKKIRMRDAKTSYERGRNYRNSSTLQLANLSLNQKKKKRQSRVAKNRSSNNLQKQLTDLNECFLMLKSTEMFKINSLREKIFRSGQKSEKQISRKPIKCQTQNGKIQKDLKDVLMKKKKIRQILQNSVKQTNLQQFRKCFNDQNYKVNPKIVEMNRRIPRSFNKTNIEKIISTMKSSDKGESNNPKFIKKIQEDIEFPGQQKLKSDLLGYMKKQIRQNGQYLVVPEKKKVLFQRLYNNITLQSKKLSTESPYQQYAENKQAFNSVNNSHDQSIFGSRIVINIPSEKTLPQTDESNKQSRVNHNSLAKTNPIQKQTKKSKEHNKKQKTCFDFHTSSQSQNKQNYNRPSQLGQFFKSFCFSPSTKNEEISKIKKKFENNKKLSTIRLNLKQQRFLFLVENGLLFDVQKQILMNQEYLFLKDKNEDNLLHLCAKNHSTQMFTFIIERFKKCEGKRQTIEKWGKQLLRDKLLEKNRNNKNVFEVARVYHAEQIIQNLITLKQQLNIREFGF